MIRRAIHRLGSEDSGAISSMFAIAILPLIVMTGVAFDYGRMMGLDSELQNAADQAALAAATQLDGSANSVTNSQIAAADALGNETRFANDGSGRTIPTSGLTFVYYEDYVDDAPVNLVDPVADPEKARVVDVTVENRAVIYALTPVMAAFRGNVARGRAMATMQSATCNVPPMMFCQPNNSSGTTNSSFPTDADIGKGLMLHFKANGPDCPPGSNSPACNNAALEEDTSVWAPGNFGFLDINYDNISGSDKNRTTGLNSDFFGCTEEAPDSRPGYRTPEGSALNSRLDYYPPPTVSCQSNGDFCPSTNTRKNTVVETNAGNCNLPGNNKKDFVKAPADIQDPGYPKDNCFVSGSCNVIGSSNNDWNFLTWMSQIHPGVDPATVPDLDGNGRITRYEAYKWEQGNPASLLPKVDLGVSAITGKRYCSIPTPINGTGVAPTSDQKDRRILTVAAVDCSRTADDPDSPLTGHGQPYIVKWVDLFLVRTVEVTGNDRYFFTEVKGPAKLAGDKSAFQNYSRRKAILLR